jgi:hypothetical protein
MNTFNYPTYLYDLYAELLVYDTIKICNNFVIYFKHMMVVTRQTTCYIFVLTSAEMAMVHSDDSLRTLEV